MERAASITDCFLQGLLSVPRAQKIERREKCEVLARAKQKRISKFLISIARMVMYCTVP